MRSVVFAFWICMGLIPAGAQQGSVRLNNVSHPLTSIQVGDLIQVVISSAAPNAPVIVKLDGIGPSNAGQTDDSGNFSAYATETSDYIGFHTERWYVNGVEVTPSNPNFIYLAYAPILPFFSVYANFVGTNCAGQSQSSSMCGNTQPQQCCRVLPIKHSQLLQRYRLLENCKNIWQGKGVNHEAASSIGGIIND